MDAFNTSSHSKRRSTLRARHKWIAARAAEALGIGSAPEVEAALAQPRNYEVLQAFLGHSALSRQASGGSPGDEGTLQGVQPASVKSGGVTPSTIYILYQPDTGGHGGGGGGVGAEVDTTSIGGGRAGSVSLPRITVTTGEEGEGLLGQAVFFWRTDSAGTHKGPRGGSHSARRPSRGGVEQEHKSASGNTFNVRLAALEDDDGDSDARSVRTGTSAGRSTEHGTAQPTMGDLTTALTRGLSLKDALVAGGGAGGEGPDATSRSETQGNFALQSAAPAADLELVARDALDTLAVLPPLDLTVTDDRLVTYGTVHPDLLLTLDGVLSRVFSPLLMSLAEHHESDVQGVTQHVQGVGGGPRGSPGGGGPAGQQLLLTSGAPSASTDGPDAVSQSIHASVKAYRAAIASARGATASGTELRVPNERWTSVLLAFANAEPEDREGILGPGVVKHAADVVDSWVGQVEGYLEDTNTPHALGDGAGADVYSLGLLGAGSTLASLPGPDSELDYWRARSQKLHALREQLKRRIMRVTMALLTAAAKSGRDFGPFALHSRCAAVLNRWRTAEAAVSAAAVESKDNVRYLSTLEKSLAPLYSHNPDSIRRGLPGLLNATSMVYRISRHYNSTERMTTLLMKVTNQLIRSCALSILKTVAAQPLKISHAELVGQARRGARRVRPAGAGGALPAIPGASGPDTLPTGAGAGVTALWQAEPSAVLLALESVLTLSEEYQHEYRLAKSQLASNPQGRQFDFSEAQIFGQFDLFCRRVVKLLDVFSTVHQFRLLATHHVHGMSKLIRAFFSVLADLQREGHDLLAFDDAGFDKAYVVFNVRVADLETSLQFFINQAFDALHSVEASLALLHKLKNVLQRDTLLRDLDSKFKLIFHQYGLDLLNCQELYENQKDRPPLARAMPPVAGAVQWARHLLDRARRPMEEFQKYPAVLQGSESKKIVKTYNRLARTLVAFEYLWHQAWVKSIPSAQAGLAATLLVRHPDDGKLYVNFDAEVLQMMREAKCLSRLGQVDIPPAARAILNREETLKAAFTAVSHVLSEYKRVRHGLALPVAAPLLRPALADVDMRLRPGLVSLTWNSLNITTWTTGVLKAIHRLEDLILSVNDVLEHRVEAAVKRCSRKCLVYLPRDETFTVESFSETQRDFLQKGISVITTTSLTVEAAVEDVIQQVRCFEVHPQALISVAGDALAAAVSAAERSRSTNEKLAAFLEGRTHEEALTAAQKSLTLQDGLLYFRRSVQAVRQHYSEQMYQGCIAIVRRSLSDLRARVFARTSISGILQDKTPFFQLEVQLAAPSVQLSPPLSAVQRAVNLVARGVVHAFKHVSMWGQLKGQTYGVTPTLATPDTWDGPSGESMRLSLKSLPSAATSEGGEGGAASDEPMTEYDLEDDRVAMVANMMGAPAAQSAALVGNSGTAMVRGGAWGSAGGGAGDGAGRGGDGAAGHRTYFELIGRDVQVIRLVLLLAGALHGSSASVREYLHSFHAFEWLWTQDRDAVGAAYFSGPTTRSLGELEGKLLELSAWKARIPSIRAAHTLGALSFVTQTFKGQLSRELVKWMRMYADAISDRMSARMASLASYMSSVQSRLEVRPESLPKLQSVMAALQEVREKAGAIASEIEPVSRMMEILQRHMPGAYVDEAATDAEAQLRQRWARVVQEATRIGEDVQSRQWEFHGELQNNVRKFNADAAAMRSEWTAEGAMQPDLSPADALPRLRRFQARFDLLSRRQDSLRESQTLFALPLVDAPELRATAGELSLCSALFGLWEEVAADLKTWRATPWANALDLLRGWLERIKSAETRVRRLPRQVKSWSAYRTLRVEVQRTSDVLPLLIALAEPYVRPRHWAALSAVVGESFNVGADAFTVGVLMGLGGGLTKYTEAVEDITDAAEKQAGIEAKLNDIRASWADREFAFGRWTGRDDTWVLTGYGPIVEELEEACLVLQTQLGLRQVGPFRDALTGTLTQLSEVGDTLELWLKVQGMWSALERVFKGGDIMNQLPSEAKKFSRIDSEWVRLMAAAKETRLVLPAASNDVLRGSLPTLLAELEKCSKSLAGYLEQKRAAYPRFYFVANATLLQLLSQGSDRIAMQRFFAKLFDAVDKVVYEEHVVSTPTGPAALSLTPGRGPSESTDPPLETRITAMCNEVSGDREQVGLVDSVLPAGNVEDWLANLEISMQRTLKSLCRSVAAVAMTSATGPGGSLQDVVHNFPAQVAIVGLQLAWSASVTHTLDEARNTKSLLGDTTKHQLSLLTELGAMCLDRELVHQPMQRIKLETLVVVQVHQRDVWSSLARGYRERRVTSSESFDWTRHTRVNWVGTQASEQHASSGKGKESVWEGGSVSTFGGKRRGKAKGVKGGSNAEGGVVHPVPLGGVLATAQGPVKQGAAGAGGALAARKGGAPVSIGADTSMLEANASDSMAVRDALGEGRLEVQVADVTMGYGYEYLGVKDRLVITPLTDRAYIAFSQALSMHYGAAPVGPAGTGKTETVKDMGRALGLYVVVTNCSSEMRFSDVAKIFRGLCQTGAWGCFDEFNRIALPVLSVVAQQIAAITNARRVGAQKVLFPGDSAPCRLLPGTGYFVTMNPSGKGYGGRSKLPDNLKSQFRSIAMMVPDRTIIIKVKLCALGYGAYEDLAAKFQTLYSMLEQQLSPQRHYDFGLRSVLSVLRRAGGEKRQRPHDNEEYLLYATLHSMNVSKLVEQDIRLFLALMGDVFPAVSMPKDTGGGVAAALGQACSALHLDAPRAWMDKAVQLHGTSMVRHGIALIGPAGSGKSAMLGTLVEALNTPDAGGGIEGGVTSADPASMPIRLQRLNPKCIDTEDLYGYTDPHGGGEWVPGVFSTLFEKCNTGTRSTRSWLVLDGPVDTVWIENLNSVLDDNKLLTLANGDRVVMLDSSRLVMEARDLRNASPATVSRCGILYLPPTALSWEPVLASWAAHVPPALARVVLSCARFLIGGTHATAGVTCALVRNQATLSNGGPGIINPHDVPAVSSHEEHLIKESGGILFFLISRACSPALHLSPVAVLSTLCTLLTSQLVSSGLAQGSYHPLKGNSTPLDPDTSFGDFSSYSDAGQGGAGGGQSAHDRHDVQAMVTGRPLVPMVTEGPLHPSSRAQGGRGGRLNVEVHDAPGGSGLEVQTSLQSQGGAGGGDGAFCDNPLQGWGDAASRGDLPAKLAAMVERMFVFSLVWAVGGALGEGDRTKVHAWLVALGAPIPPALAIPPPSVSGGGATKNRESNTYLDSQVDQGYGMSTVYDWVVDVAWRGAPSFLISGGALGDRGGHGYGADTPMRSQGWVLWHSTLPQVSLPLPLLHPPSAASAGGVSPASPAGPGGSPQRGHGTQMSMFAVDGDATAGGLGAIAAGGCDALDLSAVTVPTFHMLRGVALAAALHSCNRPVLVAGPAGSGKASMALLLLQRLAPQQFLGGGGSGLPQGGASSLARMLVHRTAPAGATAGTVGASSIMDSPLHPRRPNTGASSAGDLGGASGDGDGAARFKRLVLNGVTSGADVARAIEADLDRRGGRTFGASNGRSMIVLVDDVGVPAPNKWGDKPPLETLRQVLETASLPFMERDRRGEVKTLEDLHFIATARVILSAKGGEGGSSASGGGHHGEGPGGGTPPGGIPSRLLRHFGCVFLDAPDAFSLESMFGGVIQDRFNPNVYVMDMLAHWDAKLRANTLKGSQVLSATAASDAAAVVAVGKAAKVGALLQLTPPGAELEGAFGAGDEGFSPSANKKRIEPRTPGGTLEIVQDGVWASPALGWAASKLVAATTALLQWCAAHLLPTPVKFHYAAFNTHDIARVLHGVCRVPRDDVRDAVTLLQLWSHECHRVMGDKLTNARDQAAFAAALCSTAREYFSVDMYDETASIPPAISDKAALQRLAVSVASDSAKDATAELLGTSKHSLAVVAAGLSVQHEMALALACIGAASAEEDHPRETVQRAVAQAPELVAELLERRLRPGMLATGLDGRVGSADYGGLRVSDHVVFSPLLHTLDVHDDGLPIEPRRQWYQPIPVAGAEEEADPLRLQGALAWLKAGEEEAELMAQWVAEGGAGGVDLNSSVDLDASGSFDASATSPHAQGGARRRRSSVPAASIVGELRNPAPPTSGALLVARRVAEAALASALRADAGSPLKGVVLFQFATEHLMRIARLLSQPGGHALLVGVGGSGRCSMTRLASSMLGYHFARPAASKSYTRNQWLDDLRSLARTAGGAAGRGVALYLTEGAFASPQWMGDVHTLIVSGTLPGLFNKEELTMLLAELSPVAARDNPAAGESTEALSAYFSARVLRNLHIVYGVAPMAASAAGSDGSGAKPLSTFASLAQNFPAVLSKCTVDFHMAWPSEALVEVAHASMSSLPGLPPCLALSRMPAAGAPRPAGGWPDLHLADDATGLAAPVSGRSAASSASAIVTGLQAGSADLSPEAAAAGTALLQHLSALHGIAGGIASAYSAASGRSVTYTPKSFLALLTAFKSLFSEHLASIHVQEGRVRSGLHKLAQGAEDVAELQKVLEVKMQSVAAKQAECAESLAEIKVQGADAERENALVQAIKSDCETKAVSIAAERDAAEADLAAAKPYLDAAEEAVNKITASALVELKTMQSPQSIIRLVFDGVLILMLQPVVRVVPTPYQLGASRSDKVRVDFLKDSFPAAKKLLLQDVNFIKRLMHFSEFQRDAINEETIELLTPYIDMEQFSPDVARNASVAAEGLLLWVRAMVMYHGAAKIIKPKLEALDMATLQLNNAQGELAKAAERLAQVEAKVATLKQRYDAQMAEKNAIEEDAHATRKVMQRAQSLISSLSGERVRWQADQRAFRARMGRLPGDCALVAAFMTYCGPLDADHRRLLLLSRVVPDATARFLPVTLVTGAGDASQPDADNAPPELTMFLGGVLSDQGSQEEWRLHGLPSDSLSRMNALLVMTAPDHTQRYPLLMDPQRQAVEWVRRTMVAHRERVAATIAAEVAQLKEQEANSLVAAAVEDAGAANKYFVPLGAAGVLVFTPAKPRLREAMELALREGHTVLLTDMGSEVPPLLGPLLARSFVQRGSRREIKLGGAEVPVEVHPDFQLFLATYDGNPALTPDTQASSTLVDFTVTQRGLEEQLLGTVIQSEEAALEEQLKSVLASVTENTKQRAALDDSLLARLTESDSGNLLEDDALMEVLSSIKTKAEEVAEKLATARTTRTRISHQREVYRPAATRGAVLFIALRSLVDLNHMYQSSLEQFLELFHESIAVAPAAQLPETRVRYLVDSLTRIVVRHVSTGLFAEHKLPFRLSVMLHALRTANRIPHSFYSLLVTPTSGLATAAARAATGWALPGELRKWVNTATATGGAVTYTPRRCPVEFLSSEQWDGVLGIAACIPALATLPDLLTRHANAWADWIASATPEAAHMGQAEGRFGSEGSLGELWRLLVVRCLRPDRTVPALHLTLSRLLYYTPMEYMQPSAVSAGAGGGAARRGGGAGDPAFIAGTLVGKASDIAQFVGVFERRPDGAVLVPGMTVPLMGSYAVDDMGSEGGLAQAIEGCGARTPLLMILADGSDPHATLTGLAKRSKVRLATVGMGEGTEAAATAAIAEAAAGGSWVLLQNCHLAVKYMAGLRRTVDSVLKQTTAQAGGSAPPAAFRLLLTALPHPDFPGPVLQNARKVTVEPPTGLKAGMARLWRNTVDQRLLELIDSEAWRRLLYGLSFMHVACTERAKYGALAWSITYDFTDGDLLSVLTFLERHMAGRGVGSSGVRRHPAGPVDFATLRHMLTEVQYGGRITDTWDGRTFTTLAARWIGSGTFSSGFSFVPSEPLLPLPGGYTYTIPSGTEIAQIRDAVDAMPVDETPEVFGLHPNADRSHRVNQADDLLRHMVELTPPASATSSADAGAGDGDEEGAGGGAAAARAAAVAQQLPSRFDEDAAMSALMGHGGLHVPVNLVMFQEMLQMNVVIDTVTTQLRQLQLALAGEFPLTHSLASTGTHLERGAVPPWWIVAPSGDEISWRATSLASWLSGLLKRVGELSRYLQRGRPVSFWLSGLLNPRAFITAVKQEVCRTRGGTVPLAGGAGSSAQGGSSKRGTRFGRQVGSRGAAAAAPAAAASGDTGESWALDKLQLMTTVQNVVDPEHLSVRVAPGEGVLVHGLVVQGAAWSVADSSLVESAHGVLLTPFPVIHIKGGTPGRAAQEAAAARGGSAAGLYPCPCYTYKTRGAERCVFTAQLPSKEHRAEHWVLRGVALLCNADV